MSPAFSIQFLVRIEDHTVTLFVNDKQVGEPYALGEAFAGEIAVGIGATDGTPVRFSNLRVRKLGSKPQGDGNGK